MPFTPVTGQRFLAAPGRHAAVAAQLAEALEDTCARQGFSSVHVNFCRDDDRDALAARGWLPRIGYQYHWTNAGFATFDDYLASLRSKRRNQVRRERRAAGRAGGRHRGVRGRRRPEALVPVVYRLYRATVDTNPWGQRYLNRRVFAARVGALARAPLRDPRPARGPR